MYFFHLYHQSRFEQQNWIGVWGELSCKRKNVIESTNRRSRLKILRKFITPLTQSGRGKVRAVTMCLENYVKAKCSAVDGWLTDSMLCTPVKLTVSVSTCPQRKEMETLSKAKRETIFEILFSFAIFCSTSSFSSHCAWICGLLLVLLIGTLCESFEKKSR